MLPTELSAHVWAYFVSLIGQTCNWETFRIPGLKSWTKIADDNGVAIEQCFYIFRADYQKCVYSGKIKVSKSAVTCVSK